MCNYEDIQADIMRISDKLDVLYGQTEARFQLADARYEQNARRIDAVEARLMTPEQIATTVAKAIGDQGVLTLADLKHWARETFSPKRLAILLAMVAGALTSVEKIVSYLVRIWGG